MVWIWFSDIMRQIAGQKSCKPLVLNMDRDTCILRLQDLSQTLRSAPEVIESHKEYIPLALQLSADYFTLHSSQELQLLTAYCITDILRLYNGINRPPYTQDNQIKV